ncbi:MAG: hypothetical protein ACE1Y2_03530, partial [Stenotrophomonas maltophilia]
MTRSPHSLGLVFGRQLLWLAALLTLFFIACAAQEAPAQSDPVQSDPAQPDLVRSNGQAIIPASDPSNTQGIVSANAGGKPTLQAEPQPAYESTKPVLEDAPQPVPPQMQLLNVADTVEITRPAVVSIVAEARIRGVYGDIFSVFGSGTGVIFDPKGLVLTNTHV